MIRMAVSFPVLPLVHQRPAILRWHWLSIKLVLKSTSILHMRLVHWVLSHQLLVLPLDPTLRSVQGYIKIRAGVNNSQHAMMGLPNRLLVLLGAMPMPMLQSHFMHQTTTPIPGKLSSTIIHGIMLCFNNHVLNLHHLYQEMLAHTKQAKRHHTPHMISMHVCCRLQTATILGRCHLSSHRREKCKRQKQMPILSLLKLLRSSSSFEIYCDALCCFLLFLGGQPPNPRK